MIESQSPAASGTRLPERHLPIPRTVSAEAQAYLAIPPYGEPEAQTEPVPMWLQRDAADAALAMVNIAASEAFPVTIEETLIAGVRVHRISPSGVAHDPSRILVNLHGGGFVLGSGSLGEAIPIAHYSGLTVIAVDYRLAPEHPFPAAVEDALAVYQALLEDYSAAGIGVYGASAGGFLTAQLVARLHSDGLPQPACVGVLTGGGDLIDFGDTYGIFTLAGLWGNLSLPLDHDMSEVRAYLGEADARDPLVSPAQGVLDYFPPTLLASGTRDSLLSATALFHRALRRSCVAAEFHVFEAMPHAFWYAFHLPEAQDLFREMSAFFSRFMKPARARSERETIGQGDAYPGKDADVQ